MTREPSTVKKRWLVRPWFDEGDDWPEEPGPQESVEADSPEEAEAEYLRLNPELTSIAWLDVVPDA